MIPFTNIHTHQRSGDQETRELISLHEGFDQADRGACYSVGLHPWHIRQEQVEMEFEKLLAASKSNHVLAIGECGLDKVCSTDFELQKDWFKRQIVLANSINKPLILHCVRAFDEVLNVLKKIDVSVPFIFHGFNKKIEWAYKIIQQGGYLSFGKHLVQPEVSEMFSKLPVNRVFLETDVAAWDIQKIYEAASKAKKMPLDELKQQIAENAKLIFGKRFLHHE